MANFGDFSSNCSTTNVKFGISTFEIEYMRNLVKIGKLILFGPKGQVWVFGPNILEYKY